MWNKYKEVFTAGCTGHAVVLVVTIDMNGIMYRDVWTVRWGRGAAWQYIYMYIFLYISSTKQ
jgi:hypothetical protein